MMAIVGTLAYEFQVSLPVMASHALHAGAEGYGFMTAAMGVGAIVGGLVVAARGRIGLRPVTLAAEPAMRGRVMALWFVALQGTTPIGGPLVGVVISLAGARTGLGLGALACVIAAGIAFAARRRLRRAGAGAVAARPAPAADGSAGVRPLARVTRSMNRSVEPYSSSA